MLEGLRQAGLVPALIRSGEGDYLGFGRLSHGRPPFGIWSLLCSSPDRCAFQARMVRASLGASQGPWVGPKLRQFGAGADPAGAWSADGVECRRADRPSRWTPMLRPPLSVSAGRQRHASSRALAMPDRPCKISRIALSVLNMKRIVPSPDQMRCYLERGLTQQQIADQYEVDTGIRCTRSVIAMAIGRYGLQSAKRRPPYGRFLPWRLSVERVDHIDARMLRFAGRNHTGTPAEGAGFEPAVGITQRPLSRRFRSATPAPLRERRHAGCSRGV